MTRLRWRRGLWHRRFPSARRFGLGVLLVLSLGYLALALTSMWFTVVPGFPRGQVALDTWLGGGDYAQGDGSVTAVRTAAYVDHRVALLLHTTLGSVALGLVVAQTVAGWRGRRGCTRRQAGRQHRWIGRAYVTAVSGSMTASIAFLIAAPNVDLPGQTAFRIQLWVLALSTLGSVAVAVNAIYRNSPVAHRAWMGLSVCFLLTAPALRVMWSMLGALVPHHTMLTNMEVSAVSLAVVAPASGALWCALGRTSQATQRSEDAPFGVPLSPLPVTMLGMSGAALVVVRHVGLGSQGSPASYPWFHIVPMVLYLAGCALATRSTRRSGSPSRTEWGILVTGAAAAPWAALVAGTLASVALGPAEGYRTGLLCAPGVPIVLSMAALVARKETSMPGERAVSAGIPTA